MTTKRYQLAGEAGRPARPPAAADRDAAPRRRGPLRPFPPADRPRPVPRAAPPRRQGDRDSPRRLPARPGLPVGAAAAEGRPARTCDGRRLFPDRHAITVPFTLNARGVRPLQGGHRLHQRVPAAAAAASDRPAWPWLAPSSSDAWPARRMRHSRVDQTPPAEAAGLCWRNWKACRRRSAARRLAALQGRLADAEQDEDDLDDADRDQLIDEFTAAVELDQLRAEIAALKELVEQARRVREPAATRSSTALQGMPGPGRVRRAEGRPGQAAALHRAPRHAELPPRAPRPVGLHHLRDPRRHEPARAEARPGAVPHDGADLRGDRGRRRGHQPPVLPPDDQLRHAVEPDPPGAAAGPHPPHRPGATIATPSTSSPATPRKASR